MKVLMSIFLMVGLLSLLGDQDVSAENTLQSKIDATPEGGILHLIKGNYPEAIVLQKSILIEGEKGTTFKSCTNKPMITIKGKNVRLKGVKIESCQQDTSPTAIYVSGTNHRLEDITIDSSRLAIKLENVEKSVLRNIKISGIGNSNGFDLWQSHHNLLENVQIDHVQDGFYMENSHYNKFIDNTIRDSRYGLHIMFSNNITIKRNVSKRNFTGAMIMGSHHSIIEENKLTENNQNVNAQGILLYDVHQSKFINNTISNNRVGMYMEDSSGNELKGNEFVANFIGVQMNKIKNNVIENNSFISNVNEVQAKEGTHNIIRANYWDAAWKLDTNGDGKSNLPYLVDPYFLQLTKEVPEYQLFFQHPGMLLLQKMLKSPEHLLVTDESPFMQNELPSTFKTEPNMSIVWMISLFMIFSSLVFIYIGRKKI